MATSHGYVNIYPTSQNEDVSINYSTAPVGKQPRPYMNLLVNGSGTTDGKSNGVDDHATKIAMESAPSASVDIPTACSSLPERQHIPNSMPTPSPDDNRTGSKSTVTDARAQLLLTGGKKYQSGGGGGGCGNCDELNRILAMWEIGVSGLTRNYSRILARLIKVRDASMALEYRLQNNTSSPSHGCTIAPPPQPSVSRPLSRLPKNRQSMFVGNDHSITSVGGGGFREHDIAENMYPNRPTEAGGVGGAQQQQQQQQEAGTLCAGEMKDLTSHLAEAIDLCQQLAAACFKTNHISSLGLGKRTQSHSSMQTQHSDSGTAAASVSFGRKYSAGALPKEPTFQPSLQSIAEIRLPGGLKRLKEGSLERIPSAPNLDMSYERSSSSSHSEDGFDESYVTISKEDVPEMVTKALSSGRRNGSHDGSSGRRKGSHDESSGLGKGSHDDVLKTVGMVGVEEENVDAAEVQGGGAEIRVQGGGGDVRVQGDGAEVRVQGGGTGNQDETMSRDETMSQDVPELQINADVGSISPSPPVTETLLTSKQHEEVEFDLRKDSFISTVSTYSDTDVKFVMSKIATLEEERYKLLETINGLQEDNSVVSVTCM